MTARLPASRQRRSHGASLLGRPTLWLVGAASLAILVIAALAYATWGPPPSTAPTLGPLTGEWGPLAVSRVPTGGNDALTSGVLRISDRCVVLQGSNGVTDLLVWWRDQTRWDQGSRRILFENRDGRVVELHDGQAVSLGGSGAPLSGEETSIEGRSWDEWIVAIDWEAEPDPTCRVDSSWSVGEVLLDR